MCAHLSLWHHVGGNKIIWSEIYGEYFEILYCIPGRRRENACQNIPFWAHFRSGTQTVPREEEEHHTISDKSIGWFKWLCSKPILKNVEMIIFFVRFVEHCCFRKHERTWWWCFLHLFTIQMRKYECDHVTVHSRCEEHSNYLFSFSCIGKKGRILFSIQPWACLFFSHYCRWCANGSFAAAYWFLILFSNRFAFIININ